MITKVLRYCTRLFCSWHCVGVIEYYYGSHGRENAVIFYLFENRFGERKVGMNPTGHSYPSHDTGIEKRRTVRSLTFYKSRIVPWILGRTDREVPTFKSKDCNKREFLKQLKNESQNIVVKKDVK